jgi:hypothetical protein
MMIVIPISSQRGSRPIKGTGTASLARCDSLESSLERPEATPLALDTMTTDRARRALSHGGGIDGILFLLLAAAGIGTVIMLIVAGLQSAEASATRDAAAASQSMAAQSAEIGDL